jgi:MFS family permease
MSEEPSAGSAEKPDYRLLAPFLAHAALVQALILVVRITTSYRAIELGLPVVWLGIIATGFAMLPVFVALPVGRWIDRGNDAKACRIGAALIALACTGFSLAPSSAMHLLAFSVVLGFGHTFCMAGHQMLAVRSASARGRESALGYYMIAAAVGQGVGPFVVGWLGGEAAVPPTGLLFAIALALAAAGIAVALAIPPPAQKAQRHGAGDVIPVGTLMRLRGLPAVILASVVTITALDLLVIYLPLLGAERDIDSSHIGMMLTARSVAALASRMFYARMIFGFGRAPLTLVSMLGSGAAYMAIALPLPLPAMYGVLIVLGFAMGIASTLTISGVVHIAPPAAYGTALTLRMTGNRIGQVVFPALSGLVAAATGVAGILAIVGLGLALSGAAVPLSMRARQGDDT